MRTEKVREILKRVEALHREFESKFPLLYEEESLEGLYRTVKSLYSLSVQKMDTLGELHREMAPISGEAEAVLRDVQKSEHQMKFRLEELLGILSKPDHYSERTRLKASLDRLVHFHRIYDYTMRKALQEIGKEVESIEFLERVGGSENQKKAPTGIIEKLKKIDEIEKTLEKSLTFMRRLYLHPGDVYRVEEALIRWHRMGLLWVEARNVEKLSGVRNAGEILEGLTLIGVVERKERGGESVYKHRSFSSG